MALRPGLAALHHRGFQDPLVSFHALLLALQIDGRYCGQALELHVTPLEVFVGHAKFQAQYRGLQALLVHGGNVRSLQVLGIGLKEPRSRLFSSQLENRTHRERERESAWRSLRLRVRDYSCTLCARRYRCFLSDRPCFCDYAELLCSLELVTKNGNCLGYGGGFGGCRHRSGFFFFFFEQVLSLPSFQNFKLPWYIVARGF